MKHRLDLLRTQLMEQKLDGFLVPVNDEYMGEYVPDSAKRLTWLTGFTGSAGLAVITSDKSAFFTDGRYTLQAKAEVKGFKLYNSADEPPESWINKNARAGAIIGYDPKLHTVQTIRRYEKAAKVVTFKPVTPNPIDALWSDRPSAPASYAKIQPLKYAGESSDSKCKRIAKEIVNKGADAVVLTAPDCLCWLLNIRGNDVPYTPVILCYGLLDATGRMDLYLDEKRMKPEVFAQLGSGVHIRPPDALEGDLKALSEKRVMLDAAQAPIWFYQQLCAAKAVIIEEADPSLLPKACKNITELKGMRTAHIRDGLAVTRFLYWLDLAPKKSLTEMDVAARLESFRKESKLYLEPSFTTISGSGLNGAIVHYRVSEKTNRTLDKNSLLLIDSGGQYPDGTTDITRTVALGKPSTEMKDRFTRVLKGHIALARAVFVQGTTGGQLDALARQYLWQAGCDYDHGTGHGVGCYLSVHEGPQRISKRGGDAALAPGMILSNEPGYYKAGEYGIRIENLVMVKELYMREGKRYLGFETITLAPIDLRVVNMKMLTKEEKDWLKDYHQRVYAAHGKNLNKQEAQWLKGFQIFS